MTILGRSLRKPRLREKDGYCLLSYFDGYDDYYPTTASNGNFVNTGSLGDLSELRLGTTSTYLRIPMTSKFGHNTPLLNSSYYGYGLSTNSTTYGTNDNDEVTMDGWFYLNSTNTYNNLLMRSYNESWVSPYHSYLLRLNSSMQIVITYATGTSSFASSINSSIPISLNAWNHYGISIADGGTWKVYFNGLPVITLGPLTIYTTKSGMWCFGGTGKATGSSSSEAINGMMAGVRLHNTIRSDSWFMETYNLGIGIL